jgi:hypothetical protein
VAKNDCDVNNHVFAYYREQVRTAIPKIHLVFHADINCSKEINNIWVLGLRKHLSVLDVLGF